MDAAQTVGARPIDVQALGWMFSVSPDTRRCWVRRGPAGCMSALADHGPCGGRQRYPQFRRNASFSNAHSAGSGTLNVPGLAGLGAGVEWILSQGVEVLHEKEMALTRLFYEKIVHAPDVKIYGSFDETDRAPIVS